MTKAFLEAGFPGDQPGRHGAAVDGGAVAELACGRPGHAVADPAQGQAADVLTHGGEVPPSLMQTSSYRSGPEPRALTPSMSGRTEIV
jgi:hypothetical protein